MDRNVYKFSQNCAGCSLLDGFVNPITDKNNPKNVLIDEHIEGINNNAFYRCQIIESVNFCNSNTKFISFKAFFKCKNIRQITLAEGLKYIGNEAFAYCSKIKLLNLPKSLSFIADDAFKGCESLEKITVHQGCLAIASNAFKECPKLKEINVIDTQGNTETYSFTENSKGLFY